MIKKITVDTCITKRFSLYELLQDYDIHEDYIEENCEGFLEWLIDKNIFKEVYFAIRDKNYFHVEIDDIVNEESIYKYDEYLGYLIVKLFEEYYHEYGQYYEQ